MRRVERGTDLADERQCPVWLERALTSQQGTQVCGLHVPHGDVEETVRFARVHDRDHIRVVQRSGDSRLVQEAFPEPLAPCERRRDHLQRDHPSEPLLLGQVHDAHAALAENRFDAVSRQLAADEDASLLAYTYH